MKKWTSVLMAGTIVAGAVLGAAPSFAGDACCASKATKASASAGATCTDAQKASMSGACSTKGAFANVFKEAPGTKTQFVKVDGGMALVVTASDAKYVPVVQTAMMSHLTGMKEMAGASCAVSAGKTEKVSSADHCASMKATQASAAACPAGGAEKAAMAQSVECPDWMKVLCGATCNVEKTATGVKVMWTTPQKEMVPQLQAAGEKLQADLAQL